MRGYKKVSDPIAEVPPGIPAPAHPRTSAPAHHPGLVAVAEIVLCSSIPTQLAISGVLRLAGWDTSISSLPFVMTVALGDTVVVITLMIALLHAHGESASRLWLGDRPLKREALLGLLFVPLLLIGGNLLLNTVRLFLPGLHNVPSNPLEQLARNPANSAALAIVVILAGGVKEELQRAFLLRRFEQHLGGAGVGALVVSVLFGLAHYPQGWDAAIIIGAIGLFWAVVYLRRRSTVAPIVSHAAFDSLQVIALAFAGQAGA